MKWLFFGAIVLVAVYQASDRWMEKITYSGKRFK